MSQDQRALLEQLFADAGLSTAESAAPPATGRAAQVPLTSGQELLWWMHRTSPETTAYNVCWAVRLRGPLDRSAFGQALDRMTERHELLRTTFPLDGEAPVQRLHPPGFPLKDVDLRSLNPAEADIEVQHALDAAATRHWDLEHDRPDATLLRLADVEHVLVVAIHHMYSDMWSRGVFFRDLAAHYEAAVTGTSAAVPPLTLQFADHARREREWEGGPDFARTLRAARERLRGAPERVELPSDRLPTPSSEDQPAGRFVELLPATLLADVEAYARSAGTTPFIVLLAAFDVLLYRSSGQEDLAVLTPTANRPLAALEGLIGYFASAGVVRTRVRGAATFVDLIAMVRRDALDAMEQSTITLERIAESDDSGTDPVTIVPQVFFGLINVPRERPQLAGLTVSPIERRAPTVKFDLMLNCSEQGEFFRVAVDYNAALFDPDTIARMVRRFETLLRAALAHPTEPVARLPFASPEELVQLEAWNATSLPFPVNHTLHRQIEGVADGAPDAVALQMGDATLTFGQLESRANRLASRLRKSGVGPGMGVGLCLPRSFDLLVSMVATLKAGGHYVPLDPDYPAERVAFMLQDSRAPVVITDSAHRSLLPATARGILALDAEWPALAMESDRRLEPLAGPEDLAYVIYTSGSTGHPKGVMISHQAVVNYLHWMQRAFPLRADDCVLQKAPASFDASIWELFLPLVTGARLLLARPGGQQDPEYLMDTVARQGVTVLQLVPSQLQMVLDSPAAPALGQLRRLFCGGEALPGDLLTRLERIAPIPVTNLYGPTEATVYATAWSHDARHDRIWDGSPVPIGRPIDNVRVHIVDQNLELLPPGVPGELLIGGVGLARGYLNRPELTGDKFIPDRFAPNERSARLYRTGDRARQRADGIVEYLGRSDNQVKLRGFRIELGEVEEALLRHPDVGHCAVVVREDVPGDKRLVAYVAAAPGERPETGSLREFLRRTLPEHMVPTVYVVLASIPLSPNGKVDRKALPAPSVAERPANVGAYQAPGTAAERAVADLFAAVLRVEQVGVEDNFFDLGGHSLLAMRLLGRLETRLGTRLPYRAFVESPTVTAVAAHVVVATDGDTPAADARAVRPRAASEAPLSYQQELLWLLSELGEGLDAYNVSENVRLTGPLDVGALQQGLDALVERHEALRSVVHTRDGRPVQVVDSPRQVPLDVFDLRPEPDASRRTAADALLAERARRPFAVDRDLLLRATLVRMGVEEYLLLIESHHIAVDGWSKGVMMRELSQLYYAAHRGALAALPPVVLHNADYAGWQRDLLDSGALDRDVAYWRDQLADAPRVIELPTDRSRTGAPSFEGGRVIRALPVALHERIVRLARTHEVTPFMVYLAAFEALICRYSGQADFVVGSPVAGRTRAELEDVVGYLVNTLALRARVNENQSFANLLSDVRATCEGAYEHQLVPLERVLEELRRPGDSASASLFQVLLVLQNASERSLALDGLEVERAELARTTAKLDLQLAITPRANDVRIVFEYRSDLFDARTIERLAGHFQTLLEAAIRDPALAVGALPLLTPAERQQLLIDWNDTDATWPADATIHSRFEAQVKASPEVVAVECEGSSLTYAELNRRANRLAWRLRERGVGPDALVAVCMEKSMDVVAVLLGILKAGGAYLPMDPGYPDDRLRFMLEDSEAGFVVTEPALASRLGGGGAVLLLAEEALAPGARDDDPPPSAGPAHLCYVIYTSGSTGRPKGVLIEHRNVIRLLFNSRFQFQFDARDVWTVFHSFAFDFSVWEMYGALLYGGRLIVVPKQVAQQPTEYLALLKAGGVTVLNQTPSAFYALMQEELALPTRDLRLRYVVFGGEALQPALLRDWKARYPETTLVNMFGITETTVHVTFKVIDDAEIADGYSNIGRPIPTLTTYVLDDRLQPVPLGVTGELCVGGAGVARGYLKRPDLTAERFVPHPFRPGERLYRSGDLGRMRPAGEIEYLGRRDHQVKIRGFRIELGEIEAALAQHAALSACVVTLRTEDLAGPRLVAYFVPTGAPPAPGVLRVWAAARLPEFMVPAAFVELAALPLTSNGKVDRKALPAPPSDAADRAGVYVAPRTPTEERVASIWSTLLQVERVGAEDSFFELGGHSLLAMRMLARVQERFGVRVPLRNIFHSPTVTAVARAVDAARRSETGAGAIPRRPDPATAPLSAVQELLWHLEKAHPGLAAYHVQEMVRVRGPLDRRALGRALNALVERHETLRTVFPEEHGAAVQRVLPAAAVTVAVCNLGTLSAAEREAAAAREVRDLVRAPFDLARGPLFRPTLVEMAPNDVILVLVSHHIITDGWSQRVLRRDLSALYAAETGGMAPVAPLPVQYGDFAAWQRERLSGDRLTGLLRYWRTELAGAPSVLELPSEHPRPTVPSFEGESVTAVLPAKLLGSLKQLAQSHDATLFMVLLAALQSVLHRYTGQDDILVGAPVAGRDQAETEGLIGYFANTLVLRGRFAGGPTFAELLGRVRETCLGAYDQQDIPFEQLSQELANDGRAGGAPLVQVLLALQNMDAGELTFPGLSTAPLRGSLGQAKFDLTVSMTEGPEGMVTTVVYRTDLFTRGQATRLIGHLARLAEAAAAAPETPVARLPLLTDQEQRRYHAWNATDVTRDSGETLTALLEAQAARTPSLPAVTLDGVSLSYTELFARADRLAARLAASGVGAGDRVGLLVERSLEMMVAIIGVLKAGAAYVPLDSDYPAERLAYMAADAQLPLILTLERLRGLVPAQSSARVLALDGDAEAWAALDAAPRPFRPAGAEDLAYVIYTSGSTGRPKGVMIPHRAVVNYVRAMQEHLPLAPGDTLIQKAPISFDASVLELYTPLAAGARLLLARPGGQQDPAYLFDLIEREGVTVVQFVPSLLGVLLELSDFTARCGAVRRFLLGGEALPAEMAARLATLLPSTEIHNLYGPTETTVYSTTWTWPAQAPAALQASAGAAPIGRPVANTQIHILDANREPVPGGVTGELYIGGLGVARGYHGQPELTADRFIPDPFRGRTMYRTGDLARWSEDGTLHYAGRVDHQVKLRGFRVELGEVEAALLETGDVYQAAAVVRSDGGTPRLVGYYVVRPGAVVTASALLARLRDRLPSFMVPAMLVSLDAMPLSPSGKVDRRALPAPASQTSDRPTRTPETPVARELAALWTGLLRVERVGMDDDFFELGGNSLLAIRLVSRLRDTMRVTLTMRDVFQASTLERFSDRVSAELLVGASAADLAGLLSELGEMSDEEATRLLGEAS